MNFKLLAATAVLADVGYQFNEPLAKISKSHRSKIAAIPNPHRHVIPKFRPMQHITARTHV